MNELSLLIEKSEHKVLGIWAADVAERVLPLFEKEFPGDLRPREALTYLRGWTKTGITKMKEVRSASLNAHAAARGAPEKSPARFAARACGQAAATAHVKTHAMGASWYALKAIRASTGSEEAVTKELEWEEKQLMKLLTKSRTEKYDI